MKNAKPRVAVLLDVASGYGRHALQGIVQYAWERGPWMVHYDFANRHGPAVAEFVLARRREFDGVIHQAVPDPAVNERLARSGRGVEVFQSGRRDWLTVGEDNVLIGRLAFTYLRDRGFRRLAFVGAPFGFSDERGRAFRDAAAADGVAIAAGLNCAWPTCPADDYAIRRRIQDWVRRTERPLAVFACNDLMARMVADACQQDGIAVPEQVAVLGVDNEDVLCEFPVALSSVDHGAYQIGYRSAALLDRLMRGEPVEPGPVIVPPVRVVARRSTDVLPLENPLVAEAVLYIREHVRDHVTADDVLGAVSVSRSTLERGFRSALGRSLNGEILRARIARAQDLLVGSNLSTLEVALESGFANRQHFNLQFKAQTGLTPSAYRRQARR